MRKRQWSKCEVVDCPIAANISDITKNEFVGEIKNYSPEKISQENLITYAE